MAYKFFEELSDIHLKTQAVSLKIIELTLENFPLLPSGKPDFCKLELGGV